MNTTKKTLTTLEAYRFAQYQPSAVTTMSLTSDKKLLAVARENGSIEVWRTNSWSQIVVIPGNKNCPVRHIHWMGPHGEDVNPLYAGGKKRRLVTTGLNGSVLEWDLNGKIRTKLTSQTAIWASVKFNTE